MRQTVLLFTLWLFYLSVLSQKTTTGGRLAFNISPAILNVEDLTIGIQPGIQYNINNNWSVLTEAVLRTARHNTIDFRESRYFRVSAEIKHFFGKQKNASKFYYSLYFGAVHRSWKDADSGVYYKKKDTLVYRYDNASVKSPVFITAAKFGVDLSLGKKWALDVFSGLGIRLITTGYDAVNIRSVPKERRSSRGPMRVQPDPAYWFNQTIVRSHFTGGLRLQYYLLRY